MAAVVGIGLAATAAAGCGGAASAATRTESARTAVSSLTPTSAKNGWGPFETNTSNGEQPAGDGAPLKINGISYASGLGVHADSALEYDLGGKYAKFESAIGVDDTEGSNGSVTFEVWVDGARRFASGTLTGADAAQRISVDTANAQTLRLVVKNAGDGANHDHADWADAFLTIGTATAPSTTTTTAPSTTTTTAPSTTTTTAPSTTTTTAPSTTTTTTNPSGSTTGFPDATTTGAKGTLTRVNGNMEITQAGKVLENVEIHGQVTVKADNVTFRNVKIVSDTFWVLLVQGRNALIEDSTLIGTRNSQASLAGSNWTARRVDISGAGDGIKMGPGSKLHDSYIHDLARFDGAHNDGIELTNAPNTEVVHNTILNSNSQTSALMISEFGSNSSSNVLVSDNLLGGAGWTVYGGSPDTAQGHKVINNKFTTRFFEDSGYYGPVAYWRSTGNTWSGNTWYDGPRKGQAVQP